MREDRIPVAKLPGLVWAVLSDPANVMMGSLLRLDGVYINGKSFSFSEHVKDPANFEQRMNYFRLIFNEISTVHAQPHLLTEYYQAMDRKLETTNRLAAPYAPSAGEPLTYFEQKENAKFSQKMKKIASDFWSQVTIPLPKISEPTKNKSKMR